MNKVINLTELEQLKLENLALKRDIAQSHLRDIVAQLQNELTKIEEREGGTITASDLTKGVVTITIDENPDSVVVSKMEQVK